MDSKQLMIRIRERVPKMMSADQENRKKALWDMRFLNVAGAQWQTREGVRLSAERGDRPSYQFPILKPKIKRVINEMRANRPQGKVRAVEDNDKETAEVMEGLLRNIWAVNNCDHITDYAAQYQVGGGMGAWRVDTDYSDDTVFDQDIKVKPFLNPFCVWWGPEAIDQLKRDAPDWFISDKVSKEEFERRWPNREKVSFDAGMFDDDADWMDNDGVRIGEYWWKEPATKRLFLLQSGKTVDASEYDGAGPVADPVTKEREVKCHKIMMCIVGGGDSVLEKPTEWAGKYFPFIVAFGEYIVLEGKVEWQGLTRDGVDAQQGFNAAMTSTVETINQSPQSKFWATPDQAKGHVNKWNVAHKENLPFLLYNVDPKSPGPPQRMGSPDVPVALIQLSQMMADNVKSTTGVFDASVGAVSNETSGRAIAARQQQGEIANFNYQDNMSLAQWWFYQILMDLVPKIYDGTRSIRILGTDLAEKYVRINAVDPATGKKVNDLTAGKFDLTVTVGPSWSTRRQEASDFFTQMGQSNPALWNVAGDLMFKATDMPYSDEIADRMKFLLPPEIQTRLQEGMQMPAEVKQAMAQVDSMMQQVQQQAQLVQQAAAEAEGIKTEAEKAKLGVQSQLDALKVQQARFDADVAKQMAALMQRESAIKLLEGQLEQKVAGMESELEQDDFKVAAQEAVGAIQEMANRFSTEAGEIMQALAAKQTELDSRVDQEISMLMQTPPPGQQGAPTEAPLQ